MNRVAILAVLISLSMNAMPAWGGTLRLGAPTVEDRWVTFPIVLEGNLGNGIAALDFRFSYDPAVFKPLAVEPGPAVTEADKRLEWNVRSPGECIVVMMGMNQNVCQQGDLAQIMLQRIADPGQQKHRFAVTRPTFSSLEGEVIDAHGSTETLTFYGGSPETPEEDDPESEGPAEPEPTETAEGPLQGGDGTRAPALGVQPVSDRAPSRTPGTGPRPTQEEANPTPGRTVRRVDRQQLAAIDRMRGRLPTPGRVQGPRQADEGMSARGADAPTQTPPAGEADREVSAPVAVASVSDATQRALKAQEVDLKASGALGSAQRAPSGDAQPSSEHSTTWIYVAGALLLVVAGLVLARKTLFS